MREELMGVMEGGCALGSGIGIKRVYLRGCKKAEFRVNGIYDIWYFFRVWIFYRSYRIGGHCGSRPILHVACSRARGRDVRH